MEPPIFKQILVCAAACLAAGGTANAVLRVKSEYMPRLMYRPCTRFHNVHGKGRECVCRVCVDTSVACVGVGVGVAALRVCVQERALRVLLNPQSWLVRVCSRPLRLQVFGAGLYCYLGRGTS